MEAKSVSEIPSGEIWLYEPKWDGFRCLAFRKGGKVLLQSKSGQPLGRYFPELVEALEQLRADRFVLDGEIVIIQHGHLSFDDLLMRIHPAESRIRKLAQATPASYLLFDLLVDEKGRSMVASTLAERREKLEEFHAHQVIAKRPSARARAIPGGDKSLRIALSPATRERREAEKWMGELAASGFDGVVAKRLDLPYQSGERTGMVKIKRIRTADCVVGGFRYESKSRLVGSLLLGLYNEKGKLDHVGFTATIHDAERARLTKRLETLVAPPGFTGNAPGGPSRWSTERTGEWEPLKPKLVVEVRYDHVTGNRFRHGTKLLRWRPDKSPRQCTFDQIEREARPARLAAVLAEP
jgi:ATP-dependent DNA ligase